MINSLNTAGEFARLLLEEHRNTKIFLFWEDIFPILYGGDIVEVEERGEELWNLLFHGSFEEEVDT